MILYQLRCSNGHEFEAWFRDSTTYDEQVDRGDVVCPFCSDAQVSKAIMAPNIAPSRGKKTPPVDNTEAEVRAQEVAEKILDAVNALRDRVTENFEDVGTEFAEEARKIHYGESDERGIYGEASDDEALELDEEGVEFFRLPNPPRRDS